MAVESTIFRQKSRANIHTLTHQILLLADFTHFEQPFSLQNSKKPILRRLSLFPMYFKFHQNFIRKR